MVTTNMFGDILSDAAAMMTGSLGMLPSASIGGNIGMYEPVHGSAPDISGQDKANPLAMILSVGMMLRYSFDLGEADEIVKQAVVKTLETYRTGDIMAEGKTLIGCQEMGERVLQFDTATVMSVVMMFLFPGFFHALHSLQVSQTGLIMDSRTSSNPAAASNVCIVFSLACHHRRCRSRSCFWIT